MSEQREKIEKILEANKDKDFVQRILDPDNSPTIDMGKGMKGSHMMATAESDGVHYAYATIQRDAEGNLERLDPQIAFEKAMAQGEVIGFKTAAEADDFARNYKTVWEPEE
ncbi:MAG: hypothetical protein KAI25_11905 [Hyphomicrobiaceae bacterium]|nr:hypothetical protein [Hyphomicrobiaceae bacterium]